MKKVCKKLFSLMLVAVLLAAAIPFQAFATEYSVTVKITVDNVTKDYNWKLDTEGDDPVFDDDCLSYMLSQLGYVSDLSKYEVGQWIFKGQSYASLSGHGNFTDGDTISITLKTVCVHASTRVEETAATCTADGESKTICSDCGKVIATSTLTATGHTAGNWEVKTPATTTATGIEVQKCTKCGEVVNQRSISMLPKETVTLTLNSASGKDVKTYDKGTSITLKSPGDTNETYFESWSDGSNSYPANTIITLQTDVELTAQYAKKVTYTFRSGESNSPNYIYAKPNTTVNSPEPLSRTGMTFKGWYTQPSGGSQVNFPITAGSEDQTYYAQYYETNKEPNAVYLDVYLKGNLWNRSRRINLTTSAGSYIANDGAISIAANGDVRNLLKSYYTATNSDGIEYDGLYLLQGNHPKNWATDSNKVTTVTGLDEARAKEEVVYFVVLDNAKAKSSSSSTADPSNPKTGDSVYMAMTILGLSAASLAAVYYISKKRSVR